MSHPMSKNETSSRDGLPGAIEAIAKLDRAMTDSLIQKAANRAHVEWIKGDNL
jgi:hypothetical protein